MWSKKSKWRDQPLQLTVFKTSRYHLGQNCSKFWSSMNAAMGSIQYKWAKKWTSGLKFNQLFVLLTWRTVRLLKIKLNPNKKFQRQKTLSDVCFVIEQFKSVWLPSSIFDDNYFLVELLKMEWSEKCIFLKSSKKQELESRPAPLELVFPSFVVLSVN